MSAARKTAATPESRPSIRPAILFPLFADVTSLKGVGDAVKKLLENLLARSTQARVTIKDILFHLPAGFIDRRHSPKLSEAKDGEVITVTVTVEAHHPPDAALRRRGILKPYTVQCFNESGYISLVYYNPHNEYLAKQLPIGAERVVSGVFQLTQYGRQITHPDVVTTPDQLESIKRLEPFYPLTAGLSQRQMIRLIEQSLARIPDLPEWSDQHYLKSKDWKSWKDAIQSLHHINAETDMLPTAWHRQRLAYDEVLASQLALALVRRKLKTKLPAKPKRAKRDLVSKLYALLPYQLTESQQTVLKEINADLESSYRMVRLLQGDVGTGKTVVALAALLRVVEEGAQGALMVPTDLLGRQHLQFIEPLCKSLGISIQLLTGHLKQSERDNAMRAIESGEADIVIGTHALIQDQVNFHNLGLVVVDEQHRFGVRQRLSLMNKGQKPHILQMTATPIPRSLVMTAFGDMDCSQLPEKPPGRKPVDTRTVPISRDKEVVAAIERALQSGNKIYWICPLIEGGDEEVHDLAAAEHRFTEFAARFKGQVGIVHGRMKADQREATMAEFAGGQCNLLVATTVVEVGVNVPAATVMVIEHAERFGLAQLHQLRGRVGRSEKPSTCILLYADNCGATSKARLKAIRETDDGFRIAEEDLKIRGGGDILGTKQSGLPDFHFADFAAHSDLILTARDDVKLILNKDPELKTPRGEALRTLLYLFEHDESVRLVSG